MKYNILIIGNGFDLYHGLPTRYTDFLTFAENWDVFYSKYAKIQSNVTVNSNLKMLIRLSEKNELTKQSMDDFAKYSNAKLVTDGEVNNNPCNAKYVNVFNRIYINSNEVDDKHITYLNTELKNNKWINYFLRTDFKKEGWIDFEKEIENALFFIETYYTDILPKSKGKILKNSLTKTKREILDTFIVHDNKLYNNLNNRYIYIYKIVLDELQKQKIDVLNLMKKQLNILNKCLYIYLNKFISNMEHNLYSEQIKELGTLKLLNFNYTSTGKGNYDNIEESNYIHGELGKSNLVLGVSDDFTDNLDYIYFQKYFQRIQKRTGSFDKSWLQSDGTYTKDGSSMYPTVYFFGHSLDKTDKGILEPIFSSGFNIKIFYYNQLDYENKVINLIAMFSREIIIDKVAKNKIEFIKLDTAVTSNTNMNSKALCQSTN